MKNIFRHINILPLGKAWLGFLLLTAVLFTACQDRDLPGTGEMVLPAPDLSTITCGASGTNNYDYTISWIPANNGADMYIATYKDWNMQQELTRVDGNSYTVSNLETGVEYEFLMKYRQVIDGTEYTSPGTVIKYVRYGAQKVANLALKQEERADGITQDLKVSWDKSADATSYEVTYYKEGARKEMTTLPSTTTGMTIPDVKFGEVWNVEVVSANSDGKSLPVTASLLIGKTKFAFLSQYDTPEECIANGDDDEASAWLWFHQNYPEGEFLPFSEINSADRLSPYRMLFWMFDVETGNEADVWDLKGAETAKTAAPYVKAFVQDGGNLLLWQHAVAYVGYIERLDLQMMKDAGGDGRSINCGPGGMNPDLWKMGASFKGDDHVVNYTTHPIFKDMVVENNGGQRLVPCKGAGWTEDHNFCLAGIQSKLVGPDFDIHTNACYDELTTQHGIYPLGTWDGQWVQLQQLNVWEAKAAPKAPNGYTKGGSILCIGNGGYEFSMKNSDGTPDKSATPKNNPQQKQILQAAKNCIEYLMSI